MKKDIIENKINIDFADIISDRFSRYSKYIIQERALPDARDGLKPVQRRILYAMHYDNNTHDKPYRKSAKSVGLVIGNFHPHGDISVYDAMVRMSQNWKNNEILIDMHGNNGSIDDDPPAAMRYTEARLSKFSSLLLSDIDKETIEWSFNFDDTLLEPTVLPSRIPLLLINGSTGIAAGYATNIPPHNLSEVIDATIYRINNPNCSLTELLNFIKGPDFPTKGIIQGREGLLNAYETGKGKIVVRSKVEILNKSNNTQLLISEIPFEVVKSNLVKKITDIYLNKDVEGIIDVRDESDRDGLKIIVEIKKDIDSEMILKYLYKNTDLQVYYNFNMVSIVDKRPVQTNLKTALDTYIKHKKEVILNRSIYLKNKAEKRMHIIKGLIKAISIMDDVIELIKRSKDKNDAKNRLKDAFLFDDIQAEAIVTLRLYRLTNTDINLLKDEYVTLEKEIFNLNQILSNNLILLQVIINELEEVKKEFKKERMTLIQDEIESLEIDKYSMISNEKYMVSLTYDGYIKKTSLRSYAASNDFSGFKNDDFILGYNEIENNNNIIFFTNKGNYGIIPIYEIQETKWKDIGKHINSYLKIDSDEKIIDAMFFENFDSYVYITFLTKKGYIKKISLKSLEISRFNKVYTAIKFKMNDELIAAKITYQDDEVVVVSKNSYCNYYHNNQLTLSGLKSTGSKAINLVDNDVAVSLVILNKNDNLVLISGKGLVKKIKKDELIITNKGIKGYRLSKFIKTNTQLVAYGISGGNEEMFEIFDKEPKQFAFKDINQLSLDSNYSSQLNLDKHFYLIKGIKKIEFINIPEDLKDTYLQMEIFDEE